MLFDNCGSYPEDEPGMKKAFPKRFFTDLKLVSLLDYLT